MDNTINKIKCPKCYKYFNPKYKYNHLKTLHHKLCINIIDDFNLKLLENKFYKEPENTNVNEFIKISNLLLN